MGDKGAIAPPIFFISSKIKYSCQYDSSSAGSKIFYNLKIVCSGKLGIISKYSILLNTPLTIPRSEEIVLSNRSARRACVLSSFHYVLIGICEPYTLVFIDICEPYTLAFIDICEPYTLAIIGVCGVHCV